MGVADRLQPPTLKIIADTAKRIAPHVHRTPVMTSNNLDEITSARLFFKCENLQRVGAFKFRGATNAVMSLSDEDARRGVATHSSGNHAQALALAAKLRGLDAHVVMPKSSPAPKKAAVKGYGAKITECEPTLEARESTLNAVVKETGAAFIHPYNDYRIIAGQATATLELLEEAEVLDIIIAPVGGGGLLSGTALSTRYLSSSTTILAAEPAGADDAARSLEEGRLIPSENPQTIADGLLTSLGSLTYPIIKENVERILRVSEEGIVRAMQLLWERTKMVVEPSGAVPLAAVLEHREIFEGKAVGIILSGGNVDLSKLPF